ncbi:MAG: hypothetical protein JNL70_01490 [Saprospiraceae bacterium]|nr:hypothetical protein [Saprospiraceae bacterium]
MALTVSERDRIPDFILSSFHSIKGDKPLDFYNILRGEIEKFEKGENFAQTEQELYKLVSPNKEWNQRTFDSMESRLLNIVKKTIIYKYANIDKLDGEMTDEEEAKIEINQLLLLVRFYRERKLHQQFENTINRLKTLQENLPLIDDYFYFQYLITQEEYDNASIYRLPERIDKRVLALDSLDMYYIVNKLTILLHFEPPIKTEIEPQLEVLSKLANSSNPFFSRIFSLYKNAFHLLWIKDSDDEDEQLLDSYLQILNVNSSLLPKTQQKDLYGVARNFCVAKYKKGKTQYLKILFDLNKKNLKAGLFYHKDGTISEGIVFGALQNIVAIALRLKEIDWVLSFLKEHRHKIITPNAEEQERFYNFNMACCHFQLKEYDAALQLLNIEFDDKRYHLMARTLEIKLYYEKDNKKDKEEDFLSNRISALETYLARNDVLLVDKIGYRNFIKLLKKLIKNKKITEKDLADKNSIAEREWLIEKSKELN